MNLKAIQYIMGHKKMEMTLELYSHMNEKNAIKAFRHYMASDTNFDTNSYKNMRVIRKYVDTRNGGRKTNNTKNDCISS